MARLLCIITVLALISGCGETSPAADSEEGASRASGAPGEVTESPGVNSGEDQDAGEAPNPLQDVADGDHQDTAGEPSQGDVSREAPREPGDVAPQSPDTTSDASGDTLSDASGDTLSDASGDTLSDAPGGTLSDASGGTTSDASGDSLSAGDAPGSAGDAQENDAEESDAAVDPLEACEGDLVAAPPWFDGPSSSALKGSLEFGQTHVVTLDDPRLAPPVTAERETLLLFTPESELPQESDLRIAALKEGELLGVLPLLPPNHQPPLLEQGLTSVPLEPYSEKAWSVSLPWPWMVQGVTLRLGHLGPGGLETLDHTLLGLGSPHRFTLTRTHMVLFGDEDFQVVPPQPAAKVALDMAPWVPGAALRWVDTSPWRLDKVVVNTPAGPRWAHSEDERVAITTDDTRWNIIKHQGALRLSLANTGRGLRLTSPPQGDSSPYSFGTSMVQGWVHMGQGSYTDINNAGLAAGWTGWSGMWLNECGNGFIHEVGHTFTLLHFDEGTAAGWGIEDEYPLDGVNLETHPWGYDTVRQQFRSWYRVDAQGPVMKEGALVGKRDPMNGGEAPNALSCYPQYSAYQMKRSQAWLEDTPTLRLTEGVPTVARWDAQLSHYVVEPPAANNQAPVAIDGPVVTLIGTLGNLDEVCQTYPPIYSPEGNAFALPEPSAPDLPSDYIGGQWFLEISYADGEVERALIAKGAIAAEDTSLSLYALNLDMTRDPSSVALYRSATPYPNVDIEGAQLIHTRTLTPSPDAPKPVLRVGYGELANHELRLSHLCDPGLNCEARTATSTFPLAESPLSFHPPGGNAEPQICSPPDGHSSWSVPVQNEAGETVYLSVHAQREVRSGKHLIRVPADDATPWIEAANTRQSLKLWLPYAENAGLAAGVYQSAETFDVQAFKEGAPFKTLPIRISLTVHAVDPVTIPPSYTSQEVSIPAGDPDSSVYFVFEDPDIGPSSAKWWGDNSGDLIKVPVRDTLTGEMHTLTLRGHKIACGSWWEVNTGQSADWGCSHALHLALEEGANSGLISGHTYESPGTHPVVVRALRWHEPNAGQVLETLALSLSYSAP